MPYDLTRLQGDVAQLQHDDAGFGTGRLIAYNLILTAAHILNRNGGFSLVTAGWQVRLERDRHSGEWPFRLGNKVIWYDQTHDLALLEVRSGHPLRPEL